MRLSFAIVLTRNCAEELYIVLERIRKLLGFFFFFFFTEMMAYPVLSQIKLFSQ